MRALVSPPRATLKKELASGLSRLGLALQNTQHESLLAYLDLLQEWNRIYNLTAIREPERMLSQHLLDSLAILPWIPSENLLDVGSGAGLPGIPLAIARPELAITLLDSNQKKCAFMQQAAGQLGLQNLRIVCERVERWQTAVRYQAIVSRAFASLADFVKQVAHLLRPDGLLLAMKGRHPHEEIAQLPPGFMVTALKRLEVPGVEGERHLVLIKAAGS